MEDEICSHINLSNTELRLDMNNDLNAKNYVYETLSESEKKKIHESIKNNHIKIIEDGQWVNLTVTHVVCNNIFYGHINYDGKPYNTQLIALNKHINYLEKYMLLDKFDKFPADGELVIARYAKDDRFYRARFVYQDELGNEPIVEFFDYGNYVPAVLQDLRQWDNDLSTLPIQAVCFSMTDFNKSIGPFQNNEKYTEYMSNRTFKAEIQYTSGNVVMVKLKYKDCDVQDILMETIFQNKEPSSDD